MTIFMLQSGAPRAAGVRDDWRQERTIRGYVFLSVLLGLLVSAPIRAAAFESRVMESVVSVLPLWPGHLRGGEPGTPPGSAPEGTAVAVMPGGFLATALHVVDRATEIAVGLSDGRRLAAQLVAGDAATDIALLRVAEDLPVLSLSPEPDLGANVCAVGNQFGLGLSVTCGVVSATRRSGVGFNPIEDFIQTDAVVNPGSSGGALVDDNGRLVGMLSAIFTKESDASIGVNFAVSTALLTRVVEDLASDGRLVRATAGLRLEDLSGAELQSARGVRVAGVLAGQSAERAGLSKGDLMLVADGRAIQKVSDVVTAIALRRPGDRLVFELLRQGRGLSVEVILDAR